MRNLQQLFPFIPRRYRHYPYLIVIICLLLFMIYINHSWQHQFEDIPNDDSNQFALFDDDDMILNCPWNIQFNSSNRQHLAIIVSVKLHSFVWKNFRALLCTGIDAYIMLNEPFDISSSSRGDHFPSRNNRSLLSYTHRFLYIPDEMLVKYGVSYMSKFPRVKYTSWDRVIVWLYHRRYLKTAWVMDYGVHWFDVQNLTDFFNLYISDSSDILCADIVQTNSIFWKQWPNKHSDFFPKSYWMGTYSPLVRWSRHLLFHHYRYMQLIHEKRLLYEIDSNFRFQEFLLATIANMEQLSIALYDQKYHHSHIALGNYSTREILALLRHGKHIIHPIRYESILVKYTTDEITVMMRNI